jgi:hypothetical protein
LLLFIGKVKVHGASSLSSGIKEIAMAQAKAIL